MKRLKKEVKKELLSQLDAYVEREVAKTEASFSQWYRESNLYKPATMEDAFNEYFVRDILDLKNAVNKGEDLTWRKRYYEERAREYGRSWWDEDLKCYRIGYKWECSVYVFLHYLVAKATGDKPLVFDEVYEGYEGYGDC